MGRLLAREEPEELGLPKFHKSVAMQQTPRRRLPLSVPRRQESQRLSSSVILVIIVIKRTMTMCQALYRTLHSHRLISFPQHSDEVIYNHSVLQTRNGSLHIVDVLKAIELYFFWLLDAYSTLSLLFIYFNEKYRAFIRYFVQSWYDQMVQKFLEVHFFFLKYIYFWLSQVLAAIRDLLP